MACPGSAGAAVLGEERAQQEGTFPGALARSQGPCCLTLLPAESRLLTALSIVGSDSWLGREWAAGWLGCLIQIFFSFLSVLLSPIQLFGFTECFGVVLPSLSDSQKNRGLGGFQQFLKSLQSGPAEGEQ